MQVDVYNGAFLKLRRKYFVFVVNCLIITDKNESYIKGYRI